MFSEAERICVRPDQGLEAAASPTQYAVHGPTEENFVLVVPVKDARGQNYSRARVPLHSHDDEKFGSTGRFVEDLTEGITFGLEIVGL